MATSNRTAHADSAEVGTSKPGTSQRSTTSPYTTVNVLCLGWVNTAPETRQAHAAVEQACRSYGYSFVHMLCEGFTFALDDQGSEDISYHNFVDEFDCEIDEQKGTVRQNGEGPKKEERRLVGVVYAGNGKMEERPNAKGKAIIAINEDRTREFRISDLQQCIKRYYCDSSCELLTLVNCCDAGIISADSAIDSSTRGPDYQGPKQWRHFEEAIDSFGTLYVAFGPGNDYDFLLRLVEDMEVFREAWTVRQRSHRVAGNLKHWPAYYRKDDSGEDGSGSVVLAPMLESKNGTGRP